MADGQGFVDKLAEKYLSEQRKDIFKKLNPTNFSSSRSKLEKAMDFCEKHGFRISGADRRSMTKELGEKFKEVRKADALRQEQALIREQMREDQKRRREIEKAEAEAKRREDAVHEALEEKRRELEITLREKHGARTAELERELEELKRQHEEAQAEWQRTKSMAEQTKAGQVYVISNIGSFGQDIFKIGLTRRLEPLERVKELGDASVPFPFDVHMMISSNDAPTLESAFKML